ncbi:MAG: glutamate--tRNA ligase, partial [Candidatus Marsarchaeota archaeon]|nr:glutamate--tRNA ligase [Candidatus Marsarchaeota archaeon]
MLDYKTRELARKYALKNAFDYGKADPGAVVSKVLASEPKMKESVKELAQLVAEVVKEVNKMSETEIQREFDVHAKEFEKLDKEKQEKSAKPKMELEGAVVGKFASRFAPGPNGYMHIGHAKGAFLASEFARIYKGKNFLYFDDTNPEKDKQEFIDAFHKDLEWLGIEFDQEYYASDDIEKMYAYAKQLMSSGNAYACTCTGEEIKRNRFGSRECKHRKQEKAINEKLFAEMLAGRHGENSVVIRFMGDMKSKNNTLRDPTILRIKREIHYRQGNKYVVWPTYVFNTPIEDSIHGVTDIIRSKEFELLTELSELILKALNLRVPRVHIDARLVIKDNVTHKRELNKLIKEHVLEGWDDPRLATIAGLRRRGIQPQAIKEFVLRFGMSKTNSKVGMDMLLSENRAVIDDISRRLFLVQEPAEVKITGFPDRVEAVKLNLHPSKSLGQRDVSVSETLLISGSDAKTLKQGSKFRFKDLFNVEVEKVGKKSIEARFIGNANIDAPKFQWVDAKTKVRCELLLIGTLLVGEKFNEKSLIKVEAYAEKFVDSLEKDEIV